LLALASELEWLWLFYGFSLAFTNGFGFCSSWLWLWLQILLTLAFDFFGFGFSWLYLALHLLQKYSFGFIWLLFQKYSFGFSTHIDLAFHSQSITSIIFSPLLFILKPIWNGILNEYLTECNEVKGINWNKSCKFMSLYFCNSFFTLT